MGDRRVFATITRPPLSDAQIVNAFASRAERRHAFEICEDYARIVARGNGPRIEVRLYATAPHESAMLMESALSTAEALGFPEAR